MSNPGIITSRVRLRMDALAELVSEGTPLIAAGDALGLTKGETTNAWRRVKLGLGSQAV